MKFEPGKIRWGYIATTVAVLFLTVWAVTSQGNLPGYTLPILMTLGFILMLALDRREGNKLAFPVLIYWLALVGTSVLSIEPHRSLTWSAVIGGGLLLTLIIRSISRRSGISGRIVTGLLITGGLFGTGFILKALGWYLAWLKAYPGEWLPWLAYRDSSSNPGAAYIAGCALMAIGLALKAKRSIARIFLFMYAAVGFGLVFLASSRGALVGIALAGAAWAWIERHTWMNWLAPILNYFKSRKLLGVGALAVIVVGLAAVGWLVLNRMASHPTHAGLVFSARSQYWSIGWNMFLQSPIWGKGPFTFSAFFMQDTSVPPSTLFVHPHSAYFDVLSGSGLIGGIAYAVLVIAVFKALLRARRSAPVESQGLVLGAMLMLAGYLGHGIFDVLYNMPAASTNLVLALGAALAFDPPTKQRAPRWSLAALGLGVCILAWGAAAVRVPTLQAITAAGDGRLSQALESMQKPLALAGFSPYIQSQAGMITAKAAQVNRSSSVAKSAQHLELAAELDPFYAAHPMNLGAIYLAQGHVSEGLIIFEEAARLAPRWDLARLQIGLAEEELGKADRAVRAYWSSLELNPITADDPFWKSTAVRQKAHDLFQIGKQTFQSTDPGTDETVIRQSVAGPILERAAEVLQLGEVKRARGLVSAAGLAYFRNGLEIMDHRWLVAELAAIDGDLETAAQLGAEAVNGLAVQGVQGPGTAGWSIYGPGIYWMPEVMELVPQVKVLRLFGEWPERMERLAEWQRLVGDEAGSLETLRLLDSWQE